MERRALSHARLAETVQAKANRFQSLPLGVALLAPAVPQRRALDRSKRTGVGDSTMAEIVLFVAGSICLAFILRASLLAPTSHGYP
jgi:hypothetical protein